MKRAVSLGHDADLHSPCIDEILGDVTYVLLSRHVSVLDDFISTLLRDFEILHAFRTLSLYRDR